MRCFRADESRPLSDRGLNGIYGNKGAIVARLVVNDTSICFINVHLAAGQRQKVARNADLAAILEEKPVFDIAGNPLAFVSGGDGSAVMDHEAVILSGDLNVSRFRQPVFRVPLAHSLMAL